MVSPRPRSSAPCSLRGLLVAGALLALVPAAPARAWELAQDVDVWGYFQTWITLYEQMEEASGMTQYPGDDTAADSATGFAINRARLGGDAWILDGLLGFGMMLKLERTVEPLELWVAVQPGKWFQLRLGQFKTPTTWENLESDRRLDFPSRARICGAVADYSLSRAFYSASQLAGNRSNQRDLGIEALGEVDLGPVPLRYWFMVGNGLGANLWIGGGSNKQYVITNAPQFFYGGRLELEPWAGYLTLGGHISYNKHDDMALGGAGVVVDLDRMSWSGDARVEVPEVGLRLGGMYAGGTIGEDYYGDGKDDLRYGGAEAFLVWRFTTMLRNYLAPAWPAEHSLEIAFRYDSYTWEVDESGAPTTQEDWTIGVNYLWSEYLKVQLDYVIRRTTDPSDPDLDDDALLLAVQAAI